MNSESGNVPSGGKNIPGESGDAPLGDIPPGGVSSRDENGRARQVDALHDDLAAQIAGLRAGRPSDDPWLVERVLKESPVEVTQLVRLRLPNGDELGPFVRKIVRTDAGVGAAWSELAHAQRAGLRCPHLPNVLQSEECDGRLVVLMEYVPGPTLRELAASTPPGQREEPAARVTMQLCDACTTLHEDLGAPVIHRDITPSNVVCSGLQHETAVLIDLGIARTWKRGVESDTAHFGTRAYAAPEQFGFGQTDERTDVYALGLVAFFCLTGRDPTAADRERGFAVDGVPDGWREVIATAAAFDPNERYTSAHELQHAVKGLMVDNSAWAVRLSQGEERPSEGGVRQGPSTGPSAGLFGSDSRQIDRARSAVVEAPSLPSAASAAAPLRNRARGVLLAIWHGRNWVIVPAMALLVAACISCAFDPRLASGRPWWYDAFGYLVYMDYIVLALGYLAMDKRWLRAHVGFLGQRSTKQDRRLLVAVFVALTVALFVLTTIAG